MQKLFGQNSPDGMQSMNILAPRINLTDEVTPLLDNNNFIPLTSEDKTHIYSPWTQSLFIKVIVQKVAHQLLKLKLMSLWKPTEDLTLVDLGANFFIRFNHEQNIHNALHDGPWFIFNKFFSVQRRDPKFVDSQAKALYTATWICLANLPTKFYA